MRREAVLAGQSTDSALTSTYENSSNLTEGTKTRR